MQKGGRESEDVSKMGSAKVFKVSSVEEERKRENDTDSLWSWLRVSVVRRRVSTLLAQEDRRPLPEETWRERFSSFEGSSRLVLSLPVSLLPFAASLTSHSCFSLSGSRVQSVLPSHSAWREQAWVDLLSDEERFVSHLSNPTRLFAFCRLEQNLTSPFSSRTGAISCAEQLVKDYQAASERREKLPWRNTSQFVSSPSISPFQAPPFSRSIYGPYLTFSQTSWNLHGRQTSEFVALSSLLSISASSPPFPLSYPFLSSIHTDSKAFCTIFPSTELVPFGVAFHHGGLSVIVFSLSSCLLLFLIFSPLEREGEKAEVLTRALRWVLWGGGGGE